MKLVITGNQTVDNLALTDLIIDEHGGYVPCQNAPELYFPEKSGSDLRSGPYDDLTQAQLAKKVCLNECPVLMECRLYALVHNETDGIWGGMTGGERRSWRERNGLTAGKPQSRKGTRNIKH